MPAHTGLVSQVKYFHGGSRSSGADESWVFRGSDAAVMDEQDNDSKQVMMDSNGHGNNLDDNDDVGEAQKERQQQEQETLRGHILDGSVLISSSFDGKCKIWTEGDWKPIKVFGGLDGKLMSCDMSSGKKKKENEKESGEGWSMGGKE